MRRPWMTLARASTLVVGTTTNFLVLSQLPMAVIVAIYFTTPLATTALAALFLGEKVGARRWTAIFVGFFGVLIITQPWTARFEPAMAICLIVVAVTAVYILLTRRLAGEESAETMQFWAAALPTICLASIAFSVWSWPAGGVDWIFFALIGFFGWTGHQCWTVALRLAEASALAPLQYVQIIYAALAGWALFGDRPGLWTLIGAAVIIASGVYVWLRERRLNVA